MADVDAPFVQQVFDLAQRQREPDVEQHRRPDNGWRAVEITERIIDLIRPARLPSPQSLSQFVLAASYSSVDRFALGGQLRGLA